MITRCFSFGSGQHDPIDNSPQAETYARITAPTADMCLQVMLRLFGNRWAFEYGEDIEEIFARSGVKARMKYEVVWGETERPAPAPAPLPRRAPDDFGDDDEEALARLNAEALLDADDGPIFTDDAPPWRGVETVRLPEGDVQ